MHERKERQANPMRNAPLNPTGMWPQKPLLHNNQANEGIPLPQPPPRKQDRGNPEQEVT